MSFTARVYFFAELNAAYERLRSDPEAWQQELEERDAWDATLMDTIEPVTQPPESTDMYNVAY